VSLWVAIVLGIVEGLTEFLPVSSTGHLTIVSGLLGYDISDDSVTAFTAVIQVGAIIAVIIYFWKDIVRLLTAWVRGIVSKPARQDPNYRMAWLVILGSIPIVIAGVLGRHLVSGPLRSLWVVAVALIVWSVVMVLAERVSTRERPEQSLTWVDALIIGVAQCIALIPGVSRSGATISAGLFRNLDRVAATRLSFLLGIPALVGAGIYELPDAVKGGGIGWAPTLIATVVSFVVAYASVAWLLKFVARHGLLSFVWYRVALGVVLIILLSTGVLTSTGTKGA
jgi:undecaprenyl-diphosphatase